MNNIQIPFNQPPVTGEEIHHMQRAIASHKLCGDGNYGKLCEQWMEKSFNTQKVLLTPSCTASLEMTAILLNIKEGDEVIMPSYTFVSTANAFVLRGAKIIFVDIRPDTMNIDENQIEQAITKRTKAIVPVHYAGVSCNMSAIMEIANQSHLFVIEDAAQGVMAKYQDKPLGTIGHMGCFSFHETKNYSAGGEGGAILINDEKFIERAEIIREKGTDRNQFFRGQVDKYTWRDIGSSYLMSDLQASYLYAQLENAEIINQYRLLLWQRYYTAFYELAESEKIVLPTIPDECTHNAHMFYLKLKNKEQRTDFIQYMKARNILTVFHYVPLHSSPAGKNFGEFCGIDKYTTSESDKLVRLPLFYNLSQQQQDIIIESVISYFKGV